jgi:cysteine sulfinate desulfinase/cysteine desulfurase-like protein
MADPLLIGGGQEGGQRAGTENVLLVTGLGKAAEVVDNELSRIKAHMTRCTDHLRARLRERFTAVSQRNGARAVGAWSACVTPFPSGPCRAFC